jgi:hypothetical protein
VKLSGLCVKDYLNAEAAEFYAEVAERNLLTRVLLQQSDVQTSPFNPQSYIYHLSFLSSHFLTVLLRAA